MSGNKICGVGINDANYRVCIKESLGYINGVYKQKGIWECPYYKRWRSMLTRCYSNRLKTYLKCTVCEEWLTFSHFKAWMEIQDWEGKELDKDIIIAGNTEYGPSTCVFVTKAINLFFTYNQDCKGFRLAPSGKFYAYFRNGSNTQHLGSFNTEQEAREVHLMAKYELAKQLAAEQTDCRVRQALLERFNFAKQH